MSNGTNHRILIADDEESLRFVLRELLTREGCDVDEAADGQQAIEMAAVKGYDLYVLDMKMPRQDGLAVLREVRKRYPQALVVMVTAYGSQSLALEALKAGAYDYFTKPFDIDELKIVLFRALEKQRLMLKLNDLQAQVSGATRFGRMIGHCGSMKQVFDLIERIAEHDVTALITGESGTGKELVARALHMASTRSGGPFVTVNCAAIPEALLESELFGHERGAFTGATHMRPGKFEAADNGTILLDEIGEMPLALQAKLLRVLQEREIVRVGSNVPRSVNIRVLASTNRDLWEMVKAKTFREDLYFRLNVVPIQLPPLRERREDMPALVQYFVGDFSARFGKPIDGVSPEAMHALERYHWPGNVRELENTIQRALVMSIGRMIDLAALPEEMSQPQAASSGSTHPAAGMATLSLANFDLPLAERVEQIVEVEEKRIIEAALEKMNGKRQETADLLGISRKSLHNKMQKYGMFANETQD